MSGKEIHTKETFQVLGMSCAVCALNVETTLGAQEGVYEAKVNFAGSTVLVDYDPQVITPVELQKLPWSLPVTNWWWKTRRIRIKRIVCSVKSFSR